MVPSQNGNGHRSGKQARSKHSRPPVQSPGVHKLKSSLRQTRRLLTKDNLDANVRIETERRLKSLLADLAAAEKAKKEKSMASKYHKVKFFERQKVLRKISRTKRELESPDLPADQKKNMKSLLRSYRVQLNYILNYPKDQKYISLFPSKSSSSGEVVGTATEVRRAELLASIKKAMKRGEMDAEPETNYIVMEKERSDEEMPDADEGWSGSEPEQREQKLPNKVKNRPVEPRSPDQSSERLNDDFFEASSD